MSDEIDWVSIAAIVSALCAVLAAAVALYVWRTVRSGELGRQIHAGDETVKAHADRALSEIRSSVAKLGDRFDEVTDAIARIETHQETEEKHVLRPRDLGGLHEKINRVAEDVAAMRAASTTQAQMFGEQLRVLQRIVQEIARDSSRRSYD